MDEQRTLPADVWDSLPPAVQAYLAYQDAQITLLREQIVFLQNQLTKLPLQLADAQGRKPPYSGNSSRPPSSDPPDAPPRPTSSPTGAVR